MWNATLDEAQAGIKISGRKINNLRYADDTTLMAESEEELKSLLMKVKEESEEVGLKFNIQKTKIMTSSPITSWQIGGEIMETVRDFIILGSQNHCRWWLQPWNEKTLAAWKKSHDQPNEHIKKQRHYFVNRSRSSQSCGFSSSHVRCESWTIKKAEQWRIDAFKLWRWSHSHQDSMVLAQRQTYRSMEQNRKPRDKSTHIWTPYLWQRRQEYTME